MTVISRDEVRVLDLTPNGKLFDMNAFVVETTIIEVIIAAGTVFIVLTVF
jgi:hypothetical protein